MLYDLYPQDFRLFVAGPSWSPDGTMLATHGADGLLSIWDASSGERLQAMSGHTGAAWRTSWFPDGQRLLSADANNQIKVWDVAHGVELASFDVKNCMGAWLSPDGKQILASVFAGGPLIILNVWQSLEELVEIAKTCAVRDLTPDERVQFGLA